LIGFASEQRKREEGMEYYAMWADNTNAGLAKVHPGNENRTFTWEEVNAFVDEKNQSLEEFNPYGEYWRVKPVENTCTYD
jgi:hypothetical protein